MAGTDSAAASEARSASAARPGARYGPLRAFATHPLPFRPGMLGEAELRREAAAPPAIIGSRTFMSLTGLSARSSADQFFSSSLADADPEIAEAVGRELGRQRDEIELIASENIVSRAVLEAQGS